MTSSEPSNWTRNRESTPLDDRVSHNEQRMDILDDRLQTITRRLEDRIKELETRIEQLEQENRSLKGKVRAKQNKSPDNKKENLPHGLKEYEQIAHPVLEVIRSQYLVRKSPKTITDIAVWNLTDSENHKARLYLTSGFEWTIEPNNNKDVEYFPDDFYSWMSDNCIDIDELYNSLS